MNLDATAKVYRKLITSTPYRAFMVYEKLTEKEKKKIRIKLNQNNIQLPFTL
ncbi:hypothetical protein GLW08_21195 [Pontibacillus yanchengensis]|uniref:Uncharacterized protein n=2 Tax=Pontibacillus yanchengensis TaxID=462910 RepID=A0ACC7VMK8_9BACI|nr:hypothetical protein [Pontibacillus yanchengensis]MYL35511.1 hypothetical protein [Pontibacillus yanchengensis]MYL55819.1 hypothetical protein [Pontibacillus yanchengensis]